MKKVIFTIVFVLSIGFASAQTQNVMQIIDGVAYKCTGVNGMEFASDGSVTFLGGLVLTEMTVAELAAIGDFETNSGLGDIQVPCGASQTWVTGPNGDIWYSIFDNKCGPMKTTLAPGGLRKSCDGLNNYLCAARVGSYNSSWEQFFD